MGQIGERIEGALSVLIHDRTQTLAITKLALSSDAGNLFPLDLMFLIAAKRSVSTSHAFALLVRERNLLSCRAILRTHIDTPLRLFAFSLVADPHKLAIRVLRGEKVSNIKDRDGNQMKDAYLVQKLAVTKPWLPEVYSRLSGYIHLSAEFLGLVTETRDENRVETRVTELDESAPEESWLEVVGCFHEATCLYHEMVESWILAKGNRTARVDNPPA